MYQTPVQLTGLLLSFWEWEIGGFKWHLICEGICTACCLLMSLIGLLHIHLVTSGACWQKKGFSFVILHLTLHRIVFNQTIFICISSVLIWRLASSFVCVKENDMMLFFGLCIPAVISHMVKRNKRKRRFVMEQKQESRAVWNKIFSPLLYVSKVEIEPFQSFIIDVTCRMLYTVYSCSICGIVVH